MLFSTFYLSLIWCIKFGGCIHSSKYIMFSGSQVDTDEQIDGRDQASWYGRRRTRIVSACGDTHIVALLPLSSSPPDSTATHTHCLSLLSFSLGNLSPLTAPNRAQFPITTPQQEYSFYLPRLPNLPTNQWQGRSNSEKSV